MSNADRLRWDQIYRERANAPYPPPDPLLFEFTPPVAPNSGVRALDLAGGMGQNGLWLAEQGYTVDIMDISRAGLLRARDEMMVRQVRTVNLLQVDLDTVELPAETYTIVCVIRYLKRDLFGALRACVQPGGRIIYETYNQRYLQIVPQFNRAFLVKEGELAGIFADWKILHQYEASHISRLVAVKP
jgi:2-polyprenyl-3-methyl-5-hydroxy-6-metoxy-1,4-benzoquinol methylase